MWTNTSRNKHDSNQFSCWQKHVVSLLGANVLWVDSDFLQAHPLFMCANRVIKCPITRVALANGRFVWVKFSVVWDQLKLRSFIFESIPHSHAGTMKFPSCLHLKPWFRTSLHSVVIRWSQRPTSGTGDFPFILPMLKNNKVFQVLSNFPFFPAGFVEWMTKGEIPINILREDLSVGNCKIERPLIKRKKKRAFFSSLTFGWNLISPRTFFQTSAKTFSGRFSVTKLVSSQWLKRSSLISFQSRESPYTPSCLSECSGTSWMLSSLRSLNSKQWPADRGGSQDSSTAEPMLASAVVPTSQLLLQTQRRQETQNHAQGLTERAPGKAL